MSDRTADNKAYVAICLTALTQILASQELLWRGAIGPVNIYDVSAING